MNLYEHTIIARQDTSPAELKQLTEKYSKIVEKNDGEIVKTENWGLLNLSHLIRKNKSIQSSYSYECKTCTISRVKKSKKKITNKWEYPDW